MKLKAKMAGFRVWNKDLSDAEIGQLQQEFSVTQSNIDPSIPNISINQPDNTQSSLKKITASTNT